jgi:hypothetical protein
MEIAPVKDVSDNTQQIFAWFSEDLSAMLTASDKQNSSALLNPLLVPIGIIIISLLTALTINAHASEMKIADQSDDIFAYSNDKIKGNIEHRPTDEKKGSIRTPFVSPNPVGSLGLVSFTVNETGGSEEIESININIKGPNIGSTNPLLGPITIGSLPMIPILNTSQHGLWTGNFSFADYLPDGNYLYSLIITDRQGHVITEGPFSGIILDRNRPDNPETRIVSAVDSEGEAISNGGTTNSSNISFSFEGSDNSGVIQAFECNLDDIEVFSEHGHEEDQNQLPSTYSNCSIPVQVSQKSAGNHTYTNLNPGNHTFKVRAIDNEYDTDTTPSNFSWSIVARFNPSSGLPLAAPGRD